MGLDMGLRGRIGYYGDHEELEGFQVLATEVELGYWRKHPDLHGYIIRTFANDVDDCQPIYLEEDAIKDIINAIEDKRLPHTEGFFFGESDGTEDIEDVKIFKKALKWLKRQKKHEVREVVYQASW